MHALEQLRTLGAHAVVLQHHLQLGVGEQLGEPLEELHVRDPDLCHQVAALRAVHRHLPDDLMEAAREDGLVRVRVRVSLTLTLTLTLTLALALTLTLTPNASPSPNPNPNLRLVHQGLLLERAVGRQPRQHLRHPLL